MSINCKNAPDGWEFEPFWSAAKVPDFIWANMLAGEVLLELLEVGKGGTGGGDIPLLNGDWL